MSLDRCLSRDQTRAEGDETASATPPLSSIARTNRATKDKLAEEELERHEEEEETRRDMEKAQKIRQPDYTITADLTIPLQDLE